MRAGRASDERGIWRTNSRNLKSYRRSRSRAARRQVRESVTSRRRREGDDPPGGPRVGDEAAQRRIRMGRVVAYLAHQAEAEGIWAENGVAGPTIPFFLFFVIPISNFRYPNQI